MANDPQSYNIGAIRELLLAAFTPEELRRFCQDDPLFQPIVIRFGPGLGLDDMVGKVVDYCDTQLLFDELLAEVKEVSPRQYARFEQRLQPSRQTSTPRASQAEIEPALDPLVIPVWILVAGLGKVHLLDDHPEVYWASLAVGQAIADHGYGLLVGGWSGVDYVVAESFASRLRSSGRPLSKYLTQVVPEGEMPQFRGGHVVHGGQDWMNSVASTGKADAVVLIGGAGGTHATYEYAFQERKPVFPLAGTRGDAQRVFEEMLASWEEQPMGAVPLDRFARVLGQEVTEHDAYRIANELMALIQLGLEM